MKNGLKATFVLTLVCLATVGVVACGGSGGGATGESRGASEKLSGTVEVWDSEYESIPGYTKAINQIDAEFERLHPEVEVNRVAQPFESYEATYRAAFAAHQGPDVMVFQPGAFGVLSYASGLEVLNSYITPELQEQLTQWESVTAGYTAEGEHFGVPIGLNGFVVYYNKKLFAEAGLPTDFEPDTWAEVREAGEKLKAAGIQPFTGGNKEGNENLWWFSMGWQSENSPEQTIELGEGTLQYTDEAVANAFGPQIEMQEAGLYPSDRFTTPWFPEGYIPFVEGEGAMTVGLWNIAGYWGEFNPKLGEKNVGFFFPPGVSSVATLANIAVGIPKFAENKSAAWALIEFTVSKKSTEILHRVGGYMPARLDVSVPPSAPIQERELENALREREIVNAALAVVPGPVAYGPMEKEINQVLQGRSSLEAAQKAMQETAEKSGD